MDATCPWVRPGLCACARAPIVDPVIAKRTDFGMHIFLAGVRPGLITQGATAHLQECSGLFNLFGSGPEFVKQVSHLPRHQGRGFGGLGFCFIMVPLQNGPLSDIKHRMQAD
jgi:hypothetical protein